MSRGTTQEQGFFQRRVPLKWVLVGAASLLIVMVAIVLAVFLVDRDRDEARLAEAASAASSTAVTSPYDFSELPAGTGLETVDDAAFVSILIPDETGSLTSYGISSGLPAAQALSRAVRDAKGLDVDAAASIAAGTAGADETTASTITFVFADRSTLTLVLDLERGLVTRGDQAWQAAGDLEALVNAAIQGNR